MPRRFIEFLTTFFKRYSKKFRLKRRKFIKKFSKNFSTFIERQQGRIYNFLSKYPEYINVSRKRTDVEKRNMLGFLFWIATVLVWGNFLGLKTGSGEAYRFILWDLYGSIGGIFYFFKVAKGFKGMWRYLINQYHWYGTIIVSLYEWAVYMYRLFRWVDFFSSRRPFAYLLHVAYSSLMSNKESLWILGFTIYTLQEWVIQFWRSYFWYKAWSIIYLLIEVFFYIAFDIQLWS